MAAAVYQQNVLVLLLDEGRQNSANTGHTTRSSHSYNTYVRTFRLSCAEGHLLEAQGQSWCTYLPGDDAASTRCFFSGLLLLVSHLPAVLPAGITVR